MTFSRITPIVGVPDVDAAVDYYTSTLGFTCDPDTGVFGGVGDEGPVYAIVDRDDVVLHLQIRRRDRHPDGREDIETDVYVHVDDVDALYAEYGAAGVAVFRELYDEPYGMRDFCITDPWDNRLAFGAPIGPAG